MPASPPAAVPPHDDRFAEPTIRRRRPSSCRPHLFDEAVLRYVAHFRTVTMRQVVYRFWTLAGRSRSAGYEIIHRLIRHGLVRSRPLDVERGSASQHILTLTRLGLEALVPPPAPLDQPARRRLRHPAAYAWQLAFAQLMLAREADRWLWLRPEHLESTLERLLPDRSQQSIDQLFREAERHLGTGRPDAMPLLVRRRSDHEAERVRFVLAVTSAQRIATQLQVIRRFVSDRQTVELDLLLTDRTLVSAAREAVERWAVTGRRRVDVFTPPHYRTVPDAPVTCAPLPDLYTANGAQDPRTLITAHTPPAPLLWVATRLETGYATRFTHPVPKTWRNEATRYVSWHEESI